MWGVIAMVRSPTQYLSMTLFEIYLILDIVLNIREMHENMWTCLSSVLNLDRK